MPDNIEDLSRRRLQLAETNDNPRRHHLDRRADLLAEYGDGNPDDLLKTRAVADWLGVSTQWLEIGRSKGYGPPFVRFSPRRVRYRRGDILKWLKERTYRSTAGYGSDGDAA
jgi:predicted DNA-binding transcriptional regulator AlpA